MIQDQEANLYTEVPAGAELLRWFGRVPSFHDAEILGLDLRRRGQSTLRLHGWIRTDKVSDDGLIVRDSRENDISTGTFQQACAA